MNDLKQLSLAAETAKQEGKLPGEKIPSKGAEPVRVREWFPKRSSGGRN